MRTAFDAAGVWNGGFVPAEDCEEHIPAPTHRRFRAIFISDLHLGTPGCQAGALLDFLRTHPSDYLYLVGDIGRLAVAPQVVLAAVAQ